MAGALKGDINPLKYMLISTKPDCPESMNNKGKNNILGLDASGCTQGLDHRQGKIQNKRHIHNRLKPGPKLSCKRTRMKKMR